MVFESLKEGIIKKFIKGAYLDFRVGKATEEEKKAALNNVENASNLTEEEKLQLYKQYFDENLENETKSEMEKMKAGETYTSMIPNLIYDRMKCKDFIDNFNNTKGNDVIKRSKMLNGFFKETGKNVFIERPFRCEYGYNISMGDDCFMNYDCLILDNAEVTIGKHCLFGPRCQLITATHPIQYRDRQELRFDIAKPIHIGNECFFGDNVIVLPGVTIGDNVVVGAGSVVTKDIPSNTVVAGNPAKPIKELDPYVKETAEE